VGTVPSKYSVKAEILVWLHKKGISCDEKMRKQELVSLVATNKPKEKLTEYRSYCPSPSTISSIELAWTKVKSLVRANNVTGEWPFSWI
jgi:hypothetical protein